MTNQTETAKPEAPTEAGSQVERVVGRLSMHTLKAQKKCIEWLIYCLKMGWSEDQLDDLEIIWWRFHDKHGNLVPPNDPLEGHGPQK